MEQRIVKRDGREVFFDRSKIQSAIEKAFRAVDKHLNSDSIQMAAVISAKIEQDVVSTEKSFTVEEIQNKVESCLMDSNRKDVAKEYILYRDKRTKIRDRKSALRNSIRVKVSASDVQNQNANVDEHSFGGRKGEADSVLFKELALDEYMSEMARNNHLNNEVYTHDLDHYAVGDHNCLSIPYDEALAKGFNTRQTDVRPAKSVNTAFQLIAVIAQLQSLQQFGGVSATHLDWTMVPYVRLSLFKHYLMEYLKESEEFYNLDLLAMFEDELDDWISEHKEQYLYEMDLSEDDFYIGSTTINQKLYQRALFETRKETYQAVEGMYHNLNTLQSRSGNQLPFTSINYGTCTLPEGRMIIKALLEVSIKGIGKLHKTPIFPCGIFQCMKGVNRKPGDPNYDLFKLALKSTSKRLYPNYANVDWSGNTGYDRNDPRTYFSTMGCRTANGWDINGFGQLKDGRGNICPVTIIMPTLAMESKEYLEEHNCFEGDIGYQNQLIESFMRLLDVKIHEAKDMLIERFEHICSQSPKSAKFMYENNLMAGYIPEEGIRSALKHGTLAVGQLGLAETLQILIGCDHTEERGMELAKRIEQLFKDRCAKFKEEYKLNFGVYYTPAENLCYTAMTKFRERWGILPNISDKSFFTNSMHVPVWVEISPFDKIDIEAQLTGYSSAGCITYIELDATAGNNLLALEQLVNYAMDKDIPYFAINIPLDTCLDCGYTGELNGVCPVCGSHNIQMLRRVTGYLTGSYKDAFNVGKQQETEMRYKHSKKMRSWYS